MTDNNRETNRQQPINNTIVLKNRELLEISGVNEVIGFDDNTVTMKCDLGDLTVRGSKLHINNYDLKTAELSLSGRVTAVYYSETVKRDASFLKRIFK